MQANQYSDQEIIEALQQGEGWALTLIFNLYWKPLYTIAYRKTASHDVAEEIVQELFSDLWKKRATLFQKNLATTELYPYFLKSIKNKILNQIRANVHRQEYFEYCQKAFSAINGYTEQEVEYNELIGALEKGMSNLPKKTKDVFWLHRFEGKSTNYIAKHLNLSEKAIEYHLSKSVKFLRLYLKDFIAIEIIVVLFGMG